MTEQTFTRRWQEYAAVTRAIAINVLRGPQRDGVTVNDLVQVGRIALWECDPAGARTNLDAYTRQALHYRMLDYMRQVWTRRREVSLELRLDQGYDVVHDLNTDTDRLVYSSRQDHRHGGIYWARKESV